MKKVFITGVSGTGKTTIANELHKKGLKVISLDEVEGLCFWKNKVTGIKVDYEAVLNKEFIDAHEWECDIELLKKMMSGNEDVYVLGSASNQNDFLPFFTKILLLQCKPETFFKRIMQRTDNDFGKDEGAQQFILSWYKEFEDNLLQKGAIPIDVSNSLEKVVETILNKTK